MEFPVMELQGVIQRVMDRYVNVFAFFNMRLVCKKWREISLRTQRPWLRLMDSRVSMQVNACKLLKTIPVSTQVIQKKLRRVLKSRIGRQNTLINNRQHHETQAYYAKRALELVNEELNLVAATLERYPTRRKKQRIHVEDF